MARKKAEEQEPEENSWSGLKKTINATLTTVIAGGGVWLSTLLFGGGDEPKEETKTEQQAPAQAPVIVNVQQNQENKQKVENGGNTIIRERVIEKSPTPTQEQPKPKKEEEDSW